MSSYLSKSMSTNRIIWFSVSKNMSVNPVDNLSKLCPPFQLFDTFCPKVCPRIQLFDIFVQTYVHKSSYLVNLPESMSTNSAFCYIFQKYIHKVSYLVYFFFFNCMSTNPVIWYICPKLCQQLTSLQKTKSPP